MTITPEQIISIKASNPVPAMFERDGHKLIRVGSLHKCLCPFHRERTPSCIIYEDHFYCVTPETKVLTAAMEWSEIGRLKVGDMLIGFEEYTTTSFFRRFKESEIINIRRNMASVIEIRTESGVVSCTPNHLWLASKGGHYQWVEASSLRPNSIIRKICQPGIPSVDLRSIDYDHGYLCAMTDGDGTFRYTPGQGNNKKGPYWRVAQKRPEPVSELSRILLRFGIECPVRKFHAKCDMVKVGVGNLRGLEIIHNLLSNRKKSDSFAAGYLAGIFDAEGTYGTSDLCIACQNSMPLIESVKGYCDQLGFKTTIRSHKSKVGGFNKNESEMHGIFLVGNCSNKIGFLSSVRPKIPHKIKAFLGQKMFSVSERVISISRPYCRDIVEIETSTKTFLANGLASHNCHGCAAHGDAIAYVMKRDNCGFVRAVETLSGGSVVTQATRLTPDRTLIREENLPPEYFNSLMAQWMRDTHAEDISMLAENLGVDRSSLHRLRVAWAEEHSAFAIPMSNGHGDTVGIRLRSNDGKKWAVKGSRQGLFVPLGTIMNDLAVAEGPTDCAAVLSMGMYCVGKSAAMQSPDELITFIHKNRIQRVIVIADNDSAGVKGADKFLAACPVMACELILPTKDVRAFAQVGGSAELLNAMIKNQLWRRNANVESVRSKRL